MKWYTFISRLQLFIASENMIESIHLFIKLFISSLTLKNLNFYENISNLKSKFVAS
jgi:hypothetical protein